MLNTCAPGRPKVSVLNREPMGMKLVPLPL